MWPNPQENVDFVTFTEEILNEKLHFSCSTSYIKERMIFVKKLKKYQLMDTNCSAKNITNRAKTSIQSPRECCQHEPQFLTKIYILRWSSIFLSWEIKIITATSKVMFRAQKSEYFENPVKTFKTYLFETPS